MPHIINPCADPSPECSRCSGSRPATYNPLDLLDRDDPNAVSIAKAMSAAICPRSREGKGNCWSDTPANLPDRRPPLDHLCPRQRQKTLMKAQEIVTLTRKEFTEKYLVKMAACGSLGGGDTGERNPLYRSCRHYLIPASCPTWGPLPGFHL